MVAAISLATIAAIVFHLSQKYMLLMVKPWLIKSSKNKEMLLFIDEEIEIIIKKKLPNIKRNNAVKEFFVVLEKALEVIDSKN
ncbi:MAG: hypothetical protein KAG34_01130 [Cocleimonas sp.]|nr:hypothetical protein [Cocleimonas sp.]